MVVVGNVANVDDPNQGNSLDEKVILSLINAEEESTLRNELYYQKSNNSTFYQNPPVYLNLYLLFSVNITPYKDAIRQLSKVVEFFQGKRFFNQNNTPITVDMDVDIAVGEEYKFSADLFSLSLESSVNLWSNLNSKQLPNVIYKIRVAPVERSSITATRGVILENQLNYQENLGQ